MPAGATNSDTTELWDAVRFRNPFPFPMTTGPTLVVEDGRFIGKRTTQWVNPGNESLAYVTKTLSVPGRTEEVEVAEREAVTRGRQNFFRSTLDGTLTILNLRKEAVNMVIRKELAGDIVRVDGNPGQVVGAAGPGQLNPSTELTWRITVAADETKSISYRYTFLSN